MLPQRVPKWTVHDYLGYQKNHLWLLPFHDVLKSLMTTWQINLFCIYLAGPFGSLRFVGIEIYIMD